MAEVNTYPYAVGEDIVLWPKEQRMDFFNVVNEAREAEFQMSKLDFIIRITKPRWQALQHLNPCLSTQ